MLGKILTCQIVLALLFCVPCQSEIMMHVKITNCPNPLDSLYVQTSSGDGKIIPIYTYNKGDSEVGYYAVYLTAEQEKHQVAVVGRIGYLFNLGYNPPTINYSQAQENGILTAECTLQ